MQQSDLDRDVLGADRGCLNLNVFWRLANCTPAGQRHALRFVLRLRYTPGGLYQASYAQVGARLGVSTECARQMVLRALRYMRHPTQLRQMRFEW